MKYNLSLITHTIEGSVKRTLLNRRKSIQKPLCGFGILLWDLKGSIRESLNVSIRMDVFTAAVEAESIDRIFEGHYLTQTGAIPIQELHDALELHAENRLTSTMSAWLNERATYMVRGGKYTSRPGDPCAGLFPDPDNPEVVPGYGMTSEVNDLRVIDFHRATLGQLPQIELVDCLPRPGFFTENPSGDVELQKFGWNKKSTFSEIGWPVLYTGGLSGSAQKEAWYAPWNSGIKEVYFGMPCSEDVSPEGVTGEEYLLNTPLYMSPSGSTTEETLNRGVLTTSWSNPIPAMRQPGVWKPDPVLGATPIRGGY